MYFDKIFSKREQKLKRSIEIDDNLYTELEKYSKVYDASVADLINVCISCYIKDCGKPIEFINNNKNSLYVPHTFLIKESNMSGLEKLKDKYGVSIFRLVNMAIQFTLFQF